MSNLSPDVYLEELTNGQYQIYIVPHVSAERISSSTNDYDRSYWSRNGWLHSNVLPVSGALCETAGAGGPPSSYPDTSLANLFDWDYVKRLARTVNQGSIERRCALYGVDTHYVLDVLDQIPL